MICAQRVHRILLALLIIASIGGIHSGAFFFGATYILLGISIFFLVWAFTDFCPLLFVLKKILPECKYGKKQDT